MPSDPSRASPIVFRTPTAHDFAPLAEIRRDRRMQSLLMAIPQRTDDESVREWIDRRVHEPHGLFRAIATDDAQGAVGFIQISQVHVRNRHGFGALAVSERCTLPGVALLAMRELLRLARVELGLAKLMAEIRADNAMAIRMNTLLGYTIVGTLEKHFADHDDVRHDVVLLEKTF